MSVKYLDYAGLQRLVQNIDEKYAPIAALIFKSTVEDIEHLPALNGVKAGWMYNVTTGGGTTSDFVEGAGHVLGDGENVACVELITGYEAVAAPAVTDDPKALGWYELDGTTYVLSEDRIPVGTKTYYQATTVKKWDILGGLFDLEGKYLEFGDEFPQGPISRMVDDRTFLYMGADKTVYTYVASPEGRPTENGYFEGTFAIADTSTVTNPKQVPLYVIDTDIDKFAAVTTSGSEDPKSEGWYEEDATPGTYKLTEDESVQEGKTYYEKIDVYVRTSDITVQEGTTYYTGTFVASSDTTVDAGKAYYTAADLYKKAGIYRYDADTAEWIAQSEGGSADMIPITNKEVDDLFI